MASIDKIPFLSAPGNLHSGGAFLLSEPALLTKELQLDGWDIELREGSRYVVARGGTDVDHPGSLQNSLTHALQGLDYLSARGAADLTLTRVAETHLTWWPGSAGLIVNVCESSALGARFSMTGVARDAQGNLLPPSPEPPVVWHESMRFYRLSQLAEDLLDSLRNLWMALENLLDSIDQQQPRERESVWLKRALGVAASRVDLARYLPPGVNPTVDEVFRYFYDDMRTHLFHAKASRKPLLPTEVATLNDQMIHRHERLTRFYNDLLATVTGFNRTGGLLSYAGFKAMISPFASGCTLDFSDDPSPLSPDDTVINPAGGHTVGMNALPSATVQRPDRLVLTAEIPGQRAAELESVRRFGVCRDAELMANSTLEGLLELQVVEALRGQYSFRLHNLQQPVAFVAFH